MDKLLNDSEVKALGEMLGEARRIVLTCHVRPDGDAIGSTLGLAHLLRALGKEANVVTPDRPPRSLAFLPGFNEIATYTQHEPYCRRLVEEADLIVCCDFNKPSRQDSMAPLIQEAHCRKVLIDHHQDPDKCADLMISYPDMSSTCELVFRLIASLGLYADLSKDAATCILTGLITDTRNFSVNCKNPDIYEVLMRLLEKGCDKTRIVKEALETRSFWSLKLEAHALAEKLEIFPECRAAVTTLSAPELKEYHYERGDTEGLVNRPLEIEGVVCSFFLREDNDCVKISARSILDFPVSDICERFGGGGHRMAAGAEFHGSLEDCRKKLIEILPAFQRSLPKHLPKLLID